MSRIYFLYDGRWNSEPDKAEVLFTNEDIDRAMIEWNDGPDAVIVSYSNDDPVLALNDERLEVDSIGNCYTKEAAESFKATGANRRFPSDRRA